MFQRHVFSVVRDHGGRQRRMQREQGRTQSADSGTRLYQQQWTLAAAVVAAVAVPILNGRSLPTGTYFGTTKSNVNSHRNPFGYVDEVIFWEDLFPKGQKEISQNINVLKHLHEMIACFLKNDLTVKSLRKSPSLLYLL